MVDISEEMQAKLRAMGLYSEEQEKSLKADRKKKENKEKENKYKNYTLSNNKNHDNKAPLHKEQDIHGKYGKVFDSIPDVLPVDIATAPYNFIPLPHAVLPSPLMKLSQEKNLKDAMDIYLHDNKTFSGRIDLHLTTITPVYIGGEDGKTFSPSGQPIIPGSSLRGMVKNLYKMITCGVWRDKEDVSNRHLYYRCLMVSKKKSPFNYYLHEQYTNKMTTQENGHVKKNAKPGFLVKRKNQWYIYSLLPNRLSSIPIWKYMEQFHLHDANIKKSSIRWDGHTVYIQTGMLSTGKLRRSDQALRNTSPEERKKWGKQYYKYMSIDDIDKSPKGCHIVPDEVIFSYQHDTNRRGVDLLDKRTAKAMGTPESIDGIPAYDQIVPCFYLTDSAGEITSFGHGQSYRIPYDNAIMDAIPSRLRENVIDFADAVFGHSANTKNEASWASRVSFDDAIITMSKGEYPLEEAHMMMQPNPTSFQLYLKQNQKDKLTDWDSPEKPHIRGYKMYWHSSKKHDWRANKFEKDTNDKRAKGTPPLLKKIAPLKPGTEFSGAIRFHDLTEEELGSLLKVFSLGDAGQDIAYKIGLGKSIGLGSIRIQSHLYLEDGSRYQKLFDSDGWHISQREENMTSFIKTYEAYLSEQDGSFMDDYEKIVDVMQKMMDYKNTSISNWDSITAPIDGDTEPSHENQKPKDTRFKNRNILPTIDEVLKKAKASQK